MQKDKLVFSNGSLMSGVFWGGEIKIGSMAAFVPSNSLFFEKKRNAIKVHVNELCT